jgi:hypothetical protein
VNKLKKRKKCIFYETYKSKLHIGYDVFNACCKLSILFLNTTFFNEETIRNQEGVKSGDQLRHNTTLINWPEKNYSK